ncbi:hypothetical protein Tco_0858949 [Tanacetum coccineum]|uniref:Uncharacterized protein n=1 Tax=Tanacetum coccineum TaxID=301880 RepID=A0ABQ5BDY3_9ASTR
MDQEVPQADLESSSEDEPHLQVVPQGPQSVQGNELANEQPAVPQIVPENGPEFVPQMVPENEATNQPQVVPGNEPANENEPDNEQHIDECDALEAPYMCVYACSYENGRVNGEKDQRNRLIQFLMGLDECYANVKGQILLMQPMPTVEKAYNLIRKEEKQKEGYVQQTSILAGLSAYSNSTRTTYHNNNRINMNFTQG